MLAKMLVGDNLRPEVEQILQKNNLKLDHPDLLLLEQDKLGVEEAKEIRSWLSLKPFQAEGRGVVVMEADKFTPEAQNSLLKILEEPPEKAVIILATRVADNFLPTLLSRVEVVRVKGEVGGERVEVGGWRVEEIEKMSIEERFAYIEKIENKAGFLKALTKHYQKQLAKNPQRVDLIQELMEAEKWAKSNVNIRAILEYLMLRLVS